MKIAWISAGPSKFHGNVGDATFERWLTRPDLLAASSALIGLTAL